MTSNTRALEAEGLEAAEARITQEYRWGNLTPVGVANHLRRAGFRMEVAVEKANTLASSRAEPTVKAGVQVKALEWYVPATGATLSRVDTDLGIYRAWTHHEAEGRWFWSLDGYQKMSGEADTEEAAKAAAQADFEARILSALLPLVVTDAMVPMAYDAYVDGEAVLRADWECGRKSYCPAGVLADKERTEREWQKARAGLASPPSLPVGDDLEGLSQAFDRLYAECDLAFANELGRPIADALANLRALRASRDGYVKQATAREAEHDRQLGALRAENERLKTGADAYSKCKDLSKQGWVALTDARQFLDLGHTSDIEEAKQCVDLALASFADTIISSEARAEAAEAKLEEARKALKDAIDFLGKVQGVVLGVAMSGSSHPNPDGALMDLFHDAQKQAETLRAARSLSEESSNG
ncbi:hypothetical protein LB542_19945 [Mesorhizobium sp. BR1-1-9]|uniref:hypothetical protein n=1 Tax=Mesorhizobium sp. BR1-1-9 TaxID=2876646 RepID=UPI001CD08EEA|nr:hypothetical protein [Mesorhizobium sp. BR1-1-9]MBZ9873124.1 hypothetical protein [Mesorhizobium sp. BR1-1-9]